mmetsp:Transcript_21708/g.43476  ORF Transcript_21708/g.43476 Transcript_21708/m.43476 type:complete len:234 (-) Transcript_21708:206-907(-)
MEAENNNRRNPYIFTSEDRQGVPRDATHVIIDGSVKVILDSEETFLGHPTLLDVVCRDGVIKVAQAGFLDCPSLTRVKMPSVEGIGRSAFKDCKALMYIECGKLEFIDVGAFGHCKSLRSLNLPSAKTVQMCAFSNCEALANVKFGKELESIGFKRQAARTRPNKKTKRSNTVLRACLHASAARQPKVRCITISYSSIDPLACLYNDGRRRMVHLYRQGRRNYSSKCNSCPHS